MGNGVTMVAMDSLLSALLVMREPAPTGHSAVRPGEHGCMRRRGHHERQRRPGSSPLVRLRRRRQDGVVRVQRLQRRRRLHLPGRLPRLRHLEEYDRRPLLAPIGRKDAMRPGERSTHPPLRERHLDEPNRLFRRVPLRGGRWRHPRMHRVGASAGRSRKEEWVRALNGRGRDR